MRLLFLVISPLRDISTYIHTYIHTYVTDHSPLGLFRANETNNRNELNRLRIPNGRRQTSWLCTSAAEELNKGLSRTNPASGIRAGLELGISLLTSLLTEVASTVFSLYQHRAEDSPIQNGVARVARLISWPNKEWILLDPSTCKVD